MTCETVCETMLLLRSHCNHGVARVCSGCDGSGWDQSADEWRPAPSHTGCLWGKRRGGLGTEAGKGSACLTVPALARSHCGQLAGK